MHPLAGQVLQDCEPFKTRLSVRPDILEENKDIDLALPALEPPACLAHHRRCQRTRALRARRALPRRRTHVLAALQKGGKVQLSVRASNVHFHPPTDPTIPLVMVATGSGVAPMRGFLQERAMQKLAGRDVAKNLLFLGCWNPREDFLYGDSDLKEWAELGVVDVRPAISRSTGDSKGCRYVQE